MPDPHTGRRLALRCMSIRPRKHVAAIENIISPLRRRDYHALFLVYQPDCRENSVCVTSAGARQPHDFGQILSPITRRNAFQPNQTRTAEPLGRMRVTSFIALCHHEIPPAMSRDDEIPHTGRSPSGAKGICPAQLTWSIFTQPERRVKQRGSTPAAPIHRRRPRRVTEHRSLKSSVDQNAINP